MVYRTYILYILSVIIFLAVVNIEFISYRRLLELKTQNEYYSETNLYAAILYWNYIRRQEPNNIQVLEKLSTYYLRIGDYPNSRKTINHILCIAPKDYNNRSPLMDAYKTLTGSDRVNCEIGFAFNKFIQ